MSKSEVDNCQKELKWGPYSGPVCDVNTPTTRSDVVTHDSDGPTGYSWKACVNRGKAPKEYT